MKIELPDITVSLTNKKLQFKIQHLIISQHKKKIRANVTIATLFDGTIKQP